MRRRSSMSGIAIAAALTGAAPGPAGAACPRSPAFDAAVPTWQAVNGFPLGSRPATVDEINAYVRAVDLASSRVVSHSAGTSLAGRPLTYAVVSDPATLRPRHMSALAARLRAVRAGRRAGVDARDPVIVWLAGGVHGNEPSGSDADMRILYELAARTDCSALARLRALVTVVLPVQNPDGHVAGTRANAAGFDLNRDWFAGTQPETTAKLRLVADLPAMLFADQHEEPGTGFFFPPNDDPVHHEISSQALHAIDLVGSRLARVFAQRGVPFASRKDYDLFFMGYADTVTTTLFGAAGMTFEKGSESPYADRVEQHWLAADGLLSTATRDRAALLRGWAAQWRQAQAEGRKGQLEPNATTGGQVSFSVPRAPVYAYALRADRHAADAAGLVARLRRSGVRVRALRHVLSVPALDPYGAGRTGPGTLPRGTYIVPMAQPAKHWVEAMLGEDAYVSVARSYDAGSWSNPLLTGLEGGALRRPVPARALRAVRPPPAVATTGDAGFAFAGDSLGALELACALLTRGVAVRRVPVQGTVVVPRTAATTAELDQLAGAHLVPVRRASDPHPDAVALRAPKVALLADGSLTAELVTSSSWTRWVLERRLGLPVDVLDDQELATGGLAGGGYTALVVPDGPPVALSLAAQLALQSWVRAGGMYVGYRTRGIGVAQAAGLTAAQAQAPPPGLRIPGAMLGLAINPAKPVAWGMGSEGFVFNSIDPLLDPGPDAAHTAGSYPAGERFFASGYVEGAEALGGRAALLDVPVGAGRAVLFSFDPAFRGYTEGTERLLANALLAPPGL